MVSVDDIPVDEPTGVRGHNRSLVPVDGPQLHHDFHLHTELFHQLH